MSDTTTTCEPAITPAARQSVLSYARYRVKIAGDSTAEAAGSLTKAAPKLAARGLTARDLKRLDDAAQLLAHAGETLARAGALLDGVAHGVDVPPAHEQAEPGQYDLGGEA